MSTPFQPHPNRVSANLAVTATTANVRVRPDTEGDYTNSVRIAVVGSDNVFLRFGDSAVAATTTEGLAMLAGTIESFTLPEGATHVAAISTGTGSSINVTLGGGL